MHLIARTSEIGSVMDRQLRDQVLSTGSENILSHRMQFSRLRGAYDGHPFVESCLIYRCSIEVK